MQTTITSSTNSEPPIVASFTGESQSRRHADLSRDEVLAQLGKRATAKIDRIQLLRDAAALVAETLDLEWCAFALPSSDSGGFVARLCKTCDVLEVRDDVDEVVFQLPHTPDASMLSFAIASGKPITSVDLPKEQRFRDADLLERHVHCGIAVPFVLHERTVGAIAAFSSEPIELVETDTRFVETIASILSISIARFNAEEQLTRERRLRKSLMQNIDSLVVEMTTEGEIVSLNSSAQRCTGFDAAEIVGRSFVSALAIPEEVAPLTEQIEGVAAANADGDFNGHLLDREGERRPVRWRFSLVASNSTSLIVATGTDLSETLSLKQELNRTREENLTAQRALHEAKQEIEKGRMATAVERTQPFGMMRDDSQGERRRRPRRLYPYVQRIAPVVDGRIPTIDDFFEVRCRDIAAGGFSFLMPRPPKQTEYVAAFGVAPALTYLTATVAHTTQLEIDGKLMHIIGCEYTGRVDL
ncbi:MAG: PAS domain S-box protein [Planctomycetales bacterium]|nr:PAS domain S-box protein [Planctomycetales bacterium]